MRANYRKLRNLASNLSWSFNKKYIKPASKRRTSAKPKKSYTLEKLKKRRKAARKKIKASPSNEIKSDNQPKNGVPKNKSAKKLQVQAKFNGDSKTHVAAIKHHESEAIPVSLNQNDSGEASSVQIQTRVTRASLSQKESGATPVLSNQKDSGEDSSVQIQTRVTRASLTQKESEATPVSLNQKNSGEDSSVQIQTRVTRASLSQKESEATPVLSNQKDSEDSSVQIQARVTRASLTQKESEATPVSLNQKNSGEDSSVQIQTRVTRASLTQKESEATPVSLSKKNLKSPFLAQKESGSTPHSLSQNNSRPVLRETRSTWAALTGATSIKKDTKPSLVQKETRATRASSTRKDSGATQVSLSQKDSRSSLVQKEARDTRAFRRVAKQSLSITHLFQVVGYNKVGAVDNNLGKNVIYESIKNVYHPKKTKQESSESDIEFLSDSDNENDRLPDLSRSPSPERRPICTFLRRGPHVDKPLYNNRGFYVVKNGKKVKTPEFSIPNRSPESQDTEETHNEVEPRKKLELPPLDELPTEFYDKNGELIFKYKKPNVAGLMLLEAGLISFPEPERNSMADLDFPALRDQRLLDAMKTLKFTD